MIKKELLKLTPKERDVIFLWRIINYPKILSTDEIIKAAKGHRPAFIEKTIKKFNTNCRLKLEIYQHNKDLERIFKSFFYKEF